MIGFDKIENIYLSPGYTDLRKGIDGYALLIESKFQLNPFIFCNRHRNKIKCLLWDGTGFWLLYKRLEQGHFKWQSKENNIVTISHQQLRLLLEGLKIEQKTAFKKANTKHV